MSGAKAAATPDQDHATAKNSRLFIVTWIVLVGTSVAAAYHYYQAVDWGRSYPWNTFLFLPEDRYMDFFNDYLHAQNFLAHKETIINYTPLSHLLMSVATFLPAETVLWVMLTACLGTLVYLVSRFVTDRVSPLSVRLQQLFILSFMTYPILFAVDRGNQELVVFALLGWFVYLHYVRRSRWALVFLIVASAMKIYPIVLLAILLGEKRYRDVAIAVASVIGLTVVAALILGAWTSYTPMQIYEFTRAVYTEGHGPYALSLAAVRYRHSLWGVVCLRAWLAGNTAALPTLSSYYSWFSMVAMAALAAYVVFVEKNSWKRLTLMTLGMMFLPELSGDYALVQIYWPLLLFLNTRQQRRSDIMYAILFAVILIPLDYYVIIADVKSSVVLYPAVAIAFTGLLIADTLVHLRPGAPAKGTGAAMAPSKGASAARS